MEGYLRKATIADMDLLFEWANDPLVRQNSFTTEKITYEEHQRWFWKALECENFQQYIYMYENKAVGQVRVEIHKDTAEIGYSICQERRRQGHGKLILKLICEQVKCDFPFVCKLVGKVKTNNPASGNAFVNAGFKAAYSVFERNMGQIGKAAEKWGGWTGIFYNRTIADMAGKTLPARGQGVLENSFPYSAANSSIPGRRQ